MELTIPWTRCISFFLYRIYTFRGEGLCMRPHIYARHAKRVNTQLVVAAARGLIIAGNHSLLVDYGGNLNPEKAWAKSLLRHNYGFR